MAITIIWSGIDVALQLPHPIPLVGLTLSLVYAGALFSDELTDPDVMKAKIVPRVIAAVVNAFVIFGAASSAVNGASNVAAGHSAPQTTLAAPHS